MSDQKKFSRRLFMAGAAAGAAALSGCATTGSGSSTRSTGLRRTPSLKRMGYHSPNEKLNCAAIGAGGKGGSDIEKCSHTENVIALCDADFRRAASSFRRFPDASQYKDFRVMLDKEGDKIDACTISTPDHMHAIATLWCMERGIHVYVQKPLVHNVAEAGILLDAARKTGVKTQMGNQGHAGDGIREACEVVWSGMLGDVYEVHAWTNRPVWPQGIRNPLPAEEIPENIDWDLWLGVSDFRPYNGEYAPFNWRGWYDWGTGALGDMACHILDASCWALQLRDPISVEAIEQDIHTDQTYPNKSVIKFEFPRRGNFAPVTLYWYDGGNQPPHPAAANPDEKIGDLGEAGNGSYFVGTEATLTTGTYADGTRLVGDAKNDYKKPIEVIPRTPGATHPDYRGNKDLRATLDWLYAIKSGREASSNFEYACPFIEWILLGAISNRVPGKLYWDAEKKRFTNNDVANQYLSRQYRKGWELPKIST